ncbi:receptor-like cytosolic serine/threonine-protein kinase RBK1 isoform X2 [Salvia splendens]|uniref:receptor-like cytosolic serine/threonine-protein kinase RBK1 isoform X2 n=1 Tax=Salvia splendens TaxID=180675 RepID=UPI001C267F6F|nr:receptor-like cytosolic serine/threonine-protein kinase RBK1 isoform X2 [Salvia splendens]
MEEVKKQEAEVANDAAPTCGVSSPSSSSSSSSSSPRGVLEIPVTGGYSDGEGEKAGTAWAWEQSYGTLHWKKLFGQMKRRSPMKFSTIPLLGGYGYDLSKKAFKKRLGRNHSAGEAISCEDIAMPKPSWRNFTSQQLNLATDNFTPDNLIGKGGHAEVYKGVLPDGQLVAVKKITSEEKNNEDRVGDFLSELGIIAHIDHPNTAKLIGFSADGGLHLVLQYSPHGSLSTVLHGDGEAMDWDRRYKVAKGIAEGLLYLHCDCQRRIIHRDITASNILLSENYEAQISDFGLAKWLPENWLHHVVSPIEGTFGYMAPEYFMHGVVHEKTDVFAFGVLLLEIITGRRAVDTSSRQSLVMWAKPYLEKNNIKAIADPKLGDKYDITEMKRAMFAASICIHHLPNMRPNMSRVVKLLKGENEVVDVKQKSMGMKALLWDSCDLDDYSSTTYLKDMNRHMQLVME